MVTMTYTIIFAPSYFVFHSYLVQLNFCVSEELTVISQQVLELDEPKPFSMSITATTDETIPKLIYEWSLTRPDNRTTKKWLP
jgi:hypothetical protein